MPSLLAAIGGAVGLDGGSGGLTGGLQIVCFSADLVLVRPSESPGKNKTKTKKKKQNNNKKTIQVPDFIKYVSPTLIIKSSLNHISYMGTD